MICDGRLSRSHAESLSITKLADQAVAALGVAFQKLQVAREVFQQHSHERQLMDSVVAAYQALERAQAHVHQITEAPSEHRISDKCQTLVSRLSKLMGGAELQSFAQIVTAIQKNRTPVQKGWREGLPDLEHRISVIRSAAQELAWTAAEAEGKQFAIENQELLASVRNSSRIGRVAKLSSIRCKETHWHRFMKGPTCGTARSTRRSIGRPARLL